MKNRLLGILMVFVVFFAAVGVCFRALFKAQAASAFEDGVRIVLDAGHGGIDGGVVGKKTGKKESDLNLAIVYKLKTELEELGFEVLLTRKTEAGLYDTAAKGFKKRDMQKRKEIIESVNPSMVVSIHQNFYSSQSPRGGQVFYDKGNKNSEKLALLTQQKLNGLYAQEGVKNRKASSGEFFILNCSDCPSVIVECGFLSNERDEMLLIDGVWQKKLAKTLALGVLAYFSDISV
ncbi:MAG: N-acetylmuramoyl-L-alanine amidase [Clostridia bacterium]|nr:N-acetylmuramoyl-L-alanine amidase [Clostridia bacterium]